MFPFLDDATVLSRQEAMERARQKMQDEHNARAEEHSIKQKQVRNQNRKWKKVFTIDRDGDAIYFDLKSDIFVPRFAHLKFLSEI